MWRIILPGGPYMVKTVNLPSLKIKYWVPFKFHVSYILYVCLSVDIPVLNSFVFKSEHYQQIALTIKKALFVLESTIFCFILKSDYMYAQPTKKKKEQRFLATCCEQWREHCAKKMKTECFITCVFTGIGCQYLLKIRPLCSTLLTWYAIHNF